MTDSIEAATSQAKQAIEAATASLDELVRRDDFIANAPIVSEALWRAVVDLIAASTDVVAMRPIFWGNRQ